MKIRFYWWISIVIIMISFILYIIYIAFFHTKIYSELVSNHYYEEEIEFQEIIDEKKNAIYFTTFNIESSSLGIKINFLKKKNIYGTFNLLRLSNKHLDVAKVIQLDMTGKNIIPAYILKYGIYSLRIRWKYSGKRYFIEKYIKWKI